MWNAAAEEVATLHVTLVRDLGEMKHLARRIFRRIVDDASIQRVRKDMERLEKYTYELSSINYNYAMLTPSCTQRTVDHHYLKEMSRLLNNMEDLARARRTVSQEAADRVLKGIGSLACSL